MPLFMDIHMVDSDNFTVEDVLKAHLQDLAVEKQFDVEQIKYWVNPEAKTIFCLMKGPNKEACNRVHLKSHGMTACNIIEVSDDEYNLYLGAGKKDENDLARTVQGELDLGYRTILLLDVLNFNNDFYKCHIEVLSIIEKYGGIIIRKPQEEISASFTSAYQAILSVLEIFEYLKQNKSSFEFTAGLVTGDPVDEKGNQLFEKTILKNKILCKMGKDGSIFICNSTKLIADKEISLRKIDISAFRIIKENDFNFLEKLFNILDTNIYNSKFNAKTLSEHLGMSTAQSYRKLSKITSFSPNKLIQELRLKQSIKELKNSNKTVSEIAYDLGYNSPTYFTKAFKMRFNKLPSVIKN